MAKLLNIQLLFTMRKLHVITLISLLFVGFTTGSLKASVNNFLPNLELITVAENPIQKLYTEMALEGVIAFEVFKRGLEGAALLEPKNRDIITLLDFTKPSNEERFYVLDLKNKKLLYKSLVAHGRNSGTKYATSFSNKTSSYQSSPGFYITEGTYQGRNGYSMIINGMEKGINDNAKSRAVVVHGADYVTPQIAQSRGWIGRSHGCPALPREINKEVIDLIKNGTLFYIHSDHQEYVTKTMVAKVEHNAKYPLVNQG